MRVQFGTVKEFVEELGFAVEAPPTTGAPSILRLTCTYTPAQGQALRCHGHSGRADPSAAD